jgi:1-acylglycerone phosphate reductase
MKACMVFRLYETSSNIDCVRVITAMVGEVETKIYDNTRATPTTLAGSFYTAIKNIVFQQGTGKMQKENGEAEVTAENLVRDVLSGKEGHVWRRGVAGRARYLHWMLPERFLEFFLHANRGVYQLIPP